MGLNVNGGCGGSAKGVLGEGCLKGERILSTQPQTGLLALDGGSQDVTTH